MGENLVIRKSSYKLIELRRAWRERKERATAARQKLRWQRRAIRFGRRKPLPKMKPVSEEKVFVEAPVEEKAQEQRAPEEKAPEEKTPEIIPPTLFPK